MTHTVIDDYLANVSPHQAALLNGVRAAMHEALRLRQLTVEEGISYGLPCLKVDGKAVGGFAATKKSCSYYPFSGSVLEKLASQLSKFSKTQGALHFSDAQPLTDELVSLLIDTRLREIIA